MARGNKISVYSGKGGDGKTPIATNIVLDRDYALGTNEHFHVFDSFIPDYQLMALKANEEFPEVPDHIDIVFDLAGSITENSRSIISALSQSDMVIVPISNEIKALNSGIGTLREVRRFTPNILVVATKLDKERKDTFQDDWTQGSAFKTVEAQIRANIDFDVDIVPLKRSKAFDAIFEREQSIRQVMQGDALARYNFRDVAAQFDAIYTFIDGVNANAQQERLKRA